MKTEDEVKKKIAETETKIRMERETELAFSMADAGYLAALKWVLN